MPVADTLHWSLLLAALKSEKPEVEAPAIVLSGGGLLSLRFLSVHPNFTMVKRHGTLSMVSLIRHYSQS